MTTFTRTHGPVSTELFVRMATLLNDFNPAHYDLTFATSVGLPGVIGPGTLVQGWILADVEAVIEAPTAATAEAHRVREIDLRLRSPFGPGDIVEITYEHEGDGVQAGETVQAKAVLAEGSTGKVGATIATARIALGALAEHP
jgi:acyl dehydratase